MRILHILNDGPQSAPADLLQALATEHEVEVVDLSRTDVSYEDLIEKIFSCDKVISW